MTDKRLDRIDKLEIDLANYEQMERDIEKIIESYQLNWELDCLSLPSAIQSILERKEQECEELKRQRQADKGLITSTGKMNYQLLQEYDKLKEEKRGLIKDWEEKKNLAYEVACKNEKLKQTLAEIKEIAKKQCVCGVDCMDIKQILQKISECEV